MEIKRVEELDIKVWNDFVLNHSQGNVFQSPYYYQLHNASRHSKAFGYVVSKDNNILGLLTAVTYEDFSFPFSLFTRRTVITGGPLVKEESNSIEIYNLLLNTLKQDKNAGIYIQIRNLWSTESLKEMFKQQGFMYEEHLDLLHNLSESEDLIWTKINKNKRGNINKSRNKGTIFKEISSDSDYDHSLKLIKSTYDRVGLPLPSEDYFVLAKKILGENILKCFGAYVDDVLIGVRFELCYKDCVYDWYAGYDREFGNRYANDFLPYSIIIWGKVNGYHKFDFGGAGKPHKPYGVREHKLKFGGELVNWGRYELVLNKKIMWISSKAFRLYNTIKKNTK